MRAFVFLGHGFGGHSWERRWLKHCLPGKNERFPYGYFHAAGDHCEVEYSEDRKEHAAMRLGRRSLRRIAGFDLIHAWRNRKSLMTADVVWTYTELEHLAALLLWRLARTRKRPKLIAQSVWLFDQWNQLSVFRRRFYKWLLREADVLAVQSLEGVSYAQTIFPNSRVKWLPFGIPISEVTPPERHSMHDPLRIASLGNDMHRDWQTLLEAVSDMRCEVRIASSHVSVRRNMAFSHVSIERLTTAAETDRFYRWADIVAVPLRHNLHASGVTTVCEAVLAGVPVVCTEAGGMQAYFDSSEVKYVLPTSPLAMRGAIEELARIDEGSRYEMVRRAQRRIQTAGFTSVEFARRNYQLSEALVRQSAHGPRLA